ncbi:MAG: cytochrome-c peroxidase [Bacteroidia bacterium]
MKKTVFFSFLASLLLLSLSFRFNKSGNYFDLYNTRIANLQTELKELNNIVVNINALNDETKKLLASKIDSARIHLKSCDFWLRYLDPINYKHINGPLPVEWEVEVFEKFERPYKRVGGGLTLAYLVLQEDEIDLNTIKSLTEFSSKGINAYNRDSILKSLEEPSQFYFINRLYILNLASIYTTGFECPNSEKVIPELVLMLKATHSIYEAFNSTFQGNKLSDDYLNLYKETIKFVESQSNGFGSFDHFSFIRQYVNPLYSLNQKHIEQFNFKSNSFNDYSLSNSCSSIFSKNLYEGQNEKGVYSSIKDVNTLNKIDALGKKLFYDPILSGNNKRSCGSCHNSPNFFCDTSGQTSIHFNRQDNLPRNTPSLINSNFNHLLMLDGFHISLQNQAKAVMLNPIEMGGSEEEIVRKVMSCDEYANTFKELLPLIKKQKVDIEQISSALTSYYTKFSYFYSPFDNMMNNKKSADKDVAKGFNIFMGKAQCATCHFPPFFNGVKPPYVGSEFEVLGVPSDKNYKSLSPDRGRYDVFNAKETMNAFRTGTLKNIAKTAPYMHNGVFKTMEEVMEFYNNGGGVGHKLKVSNQTLSSDSLQLTKIEIDKVITFLTALTEDIPFEPIPVHLPKSNINKLNKRVPNGEY